MRSTDGVVRIALTAKGATDRNSGQRNRKKDIWPTGDRRLRGDIEGWVEKPLSDEAAKPTSRQAISQHARNEFDKEEKETRE